MTVDKPLSGALLRMQFSVPPYRHIPGQNQRHGEAEFETVLAEVEKLGKVENIAQSPVWEFTLALLENEFYWEAHEVLEAIWMKALPNSTEAILLKGMIQVANCGLKRRMGRQSAAGKLQKQANDQLELAYRNDPDAIIMNFSRSKAEELFHSYTM